MKKLPEVTVHGRFQPPMHINHWNYVRKAFEQAEHVTILITNPHNDESFDESASWRNDPANNPFSYDERVFMFKKFLKAKGISSDRYRLKPFNIKDPESFQKLKKDVPNMVNVYSEWSAKKVAAFEQEGLKVIRLDDAKEKPVSGTQIREVISKSKDEQQLETELVHIGFMPEAIPGLIQVLREKREK